MKKRVVIAGNLIVDIIKRIEVYPEKNMLATVTKISKSVGGCVPNVAIDLKRLEPSLDIAAYGKVGADEEGDFLLGELKKNGIDTAHIKRDALGTSFTDVMTEQSGARTFFQYRGANASFSPEDIDLEGLDCDLFHIGYALLLDSMDEEDKEYGTKMARLLHDVQSRGIKTSLDVVSETSARFKKIVAPAVAYCDYVVLNESEAGLVAQIEPRNGDGSINLKALESILKKFLSYGVREKVVIHCPEVGVSMRAGQSVMTVVPSLKLPQGYIKGTVGAGDAFCAGILYSALCGKGDGEALEIAACAAAANLAVADSVSGAVSAAEALKLKELYGRRA